MCEAIAIITIHIFYIFCHQLSSDDAFLYCFSLLSCTEGLFINNDTLFRVLQTHPPKIVTYCYVLATPPPTNQYIVYTIYINCSIIVNGGWESKIFSCLVMFWQPPCPPSHSRCNVIYEWPLSNFVKGMTFIYIIADYSSYQLPSTVTKVCHYY